MTYPAGTLVLSITDVHAARNDPWAQPKPGTVVGPSQEYGYHFVQWPEFPVPVKEEDWTLVTFEAPRRGPNPDAADLAADRAGL